MRSEKYIKNNLNQVLDDIAPDVLTNILATDRVKVESIENDLRDEPLFLDEVQDNRNSFRSRMGVLATVMLLMVIVCAAFIPKLAINPNKVYCTITLDINPSINLHMNKKGQVVKVDANNNDGTQIAKQINKKLTEEYYTEDAIWDVVSEFKDAGYLDKKNATMLISADKSYKGSSTGIGKARKTINKYKNDNEDDFVAVYQEYKQSKKVSKIAKDNGISVAKAAYCLKVSEKTDENYDDLCKASIAKITDKVVTDHIDLGEEIEVVEEIESIVEEIEMTVEETTEEIETAEETLAEEDIETTSQVMMTEVMTEANVETTKVVEESKADETTQEIQTTVAVLETTTVAENVTEEIPQ